MKDYIIYEIATPLDKEGYCMIDFTVDGVPRARRSFRGYSYLYAIDAGLNWVNGILREDQFTFEEFLRAGADLGS